MTETKKGSISDRLKALKSARSKSALDNRRAVYNEASGRKAQYAEKRKLDALKDREDELAETEDHINGEPKKDKEQEKEMDVGILDYTAEEDHCWRLKQGRIDSHLRTSNAKQGILQNYKQLASQTYTKNIREIEEQGKKTAKEYKKEKQQYDKLRSQGLSPAEIRTRVTSNEKLERYIGKINSWEERVSKKRRKITDEGKDSAIHEKNRQFNNKLKRHYGVVDK